MGLACLWHAAAGVKADKPGVISTHPTPPSMAPLVLTDAVHPPTVTLVSIPGGGCLPTTMAEGYLPHHGDCRQGCN